MSTFPDDDAYALGRTAEEERRLQRQAALYNPWSRRLFEAAGIRAGMKVLDLGSGAGDVAMLSAEMVGPTGCVVGVDINSSILDTARRRAAAAGYANVGFIAGDALTVPLDSDFDAVVGRAILLYLGDPVAVLNRLLHHMKAGGVAAFTEPDCFAGAAANPPCPLNDRMHEWVSRGLAFGGADLAIGMKLHRVLVDAGFRAPTMIVDALIGGGAAFVEEFTGFATDTVRSLIPALVKGGIATEAEIDIDTLASRFRDEVLGRRATIRSFPFIGAWALKD